MFVELDEVVALAKSTIGTASEHDELLFRNWIWNGMQDLGTSEDDIKACTIKVKNLLAKKPEDCRILMDIALYDVNGCAIPHRFRAGNRRIYPNLSNGSLVTSDGDIVPILVDVSEDHYNIILGSNGENVYTIAIRYFSYPLDVNGLPLIKQSEVMALVYFCRFMWAMRKNDNRSEIEQNRSMWLLESDRCRAKKKMLTDEKAKTVVRNWMTLIPSFNFQKF